VADIGPYVLVLATALVSGAGGYLRSSLRTRAAGRTAARLVHAELLQQILPLGFSRQPGALLTSIADVFGVPVNQFRREESVGTSDWLLGDAMFHPRPGIDGVRSLVEPGTAFDDEVLGKDQQPAHRRDFVRLPDTNDNGGVHLDCEIPNHALYLAAMAIGGYAWEAGRICSRRCTTQI
jgi:Zn-dependent metalloprotease